jgi:protein-L-isoaspartate(D-aspartate) O-methyltransferase
MVEPSGDPWQLAMTRYQNYPRKGELKEHVWDFLKRTAGWTRSLTKSDTFVPFLPGALIMLFFLILTFMAACGFSTNGNDLKEQEYRFRAARQQMVEKQLRQRGVRDERVLQAMETVPRHLFVPLASQSQAYDDGPLSIGQEQTISQPYIVALMTESIRLEGTETVLEIGTGSGYQAAVLSHLVRQVYSIEIIPQLAETARQRLVSLGYKNVEVIVGDGNKGWEAGGPYEAIIVTAAAPEIPPTLLEQLAEGGRMVLPVQVGEEQHLLCLQKVEGRIIREDLGPVRFVPLVSGAKS